MLLLSAAVPDMLELESKRQTSGIPALIPLMHFSPFLWQQSAGHSLLSLGGASSIPGTDCPREGNIALPFAMDRSKLHLNRVTPRNTCSILPTSLCGKTEGEVFEKGEKIVQILLKASFAIK